MPEPSFIAPLVPRTAADERWHLRAELREAAQQSFFYAFPVLIALLALAAYGAAWLGLLALPGLYFGGRKALRKNDRPRTGAFPGPLRSPEKPLPPTPYEQRLCAVLAAQDGRQQLNSLLLVGALLAAGDLLRWPFSALNFLRTLPESVLCGVVACFCAALGGYWIVLGGRYLAARATVDTGGAL